MKKRIYVPSAGVDDWRRLTASPEIHWKEGYSARSLAYSWESATGFPTRVKATLDSCCDLKELELLLVIPEHTVALAGSGKGSQNDAWVLAGNQNGLISIAVEGKVDESFDKTLGRWKDWDEDSTETRTNKEHRVREICKMLDIEIPPDEIRYQLLHRCASAILEALRFRAPKAMLLIHSFSPEKKWMEDFQNFVQLFGLTYKGDENEVVFKTLSNGISLYFSWVSGDLKYTKM